MADDKGLYARASDKVEENLWKFTGQEFTREQMQKECGCDLRTGVHTDQKNAVTRVLYEWSDQNPKRVKPLLRQVGRNGYKIIDRSLQPLVWGTSTSDSKLIFPRDADTGLELPFAYQIVISPGDVIGIAGESNTAKTALAWNFIAENMENMEVIAWLSEFHPHQTRRRMSWSNIFDENGQPRIPTYPMKNPYDLPEKMSNHPSALHILDWVNLGDRFWDIGKILEHIQNVIAGEGYAVVFTQKSVGKEEGVGGHFGKDNTSLYFTLSELDNYYKKIKIIKVKEPNGHNPERKMYRFVVGSKGGQIVDVDEIKDCRKCRAKGTVFARGEGDVACEACEGRGYNVLAKDMVTIP